MDLLKTFGVVATTPLVDDFGFFEVFSVEFDVFGVDSFQEVEFLFEFLNFEGLFFIGFDESLIGENETLVVTLDLVELFRHHPTVDLFPFKEFLPLFQFLLHFQKLILFLTQKTVQLPLILQRSLMLVLVLVVHRYVFLRVH